MSGLRPSPAEIEEHRRQNYALWQQMATRWERHRVGLWEPQSVSQHVVQRWPRPYAARRLRRFPNPVGAINRAVYPERIVLCSDALANASRDAPAGEQTAR